MRRDNPRSRQRRQQVIRTLCNQLRFATRLVQFVAITLYVWIGFEIALLLRRSRKRIDVVNKWLPRWARGCLRIYGVQMECCCQGVPTGELYPALSSTGVGRIFVINHSSGMDIPIVLSVAEAHVISRHDLARWPLIGQSAARVGTLFVDRSSQRSGASVLKVIANTLAAGEGVAMFPEGTAHPGDEVFEFRPGAFNAARRAGAEIVPLGIAYGDKVAYYRKESFMAHIKRISKLRRLKVAVEIGQPLLLEVGTPVETIEQARQQVQQLVNRARARLEGQ